MLCFKLWECEEDFIAWRIEATVRLRCGRRKSTSGNHKPLLHVIRQGCNIKSNASIAREVLFHSERAETFMQSVPVGLSHPTKAFQSIFL